MDTRYVDVVTTATLRPGTLRQTLDSFRALFDQHTHWRLILNIDPVGEPGVRPVDVQRVASDYFREIVVRQPAQASFPAAWYWAVSKLEAEYVFWLEDDWELFRDVDFQEMLAILDANHELATLRLPRWLATDTFRQWNRKTLSSWSPCGRYGLIPQELKIHCGYSNNPSLTRREFLQPMLPHFHGPTDPEKQIAGFNPILRPWVAHWEYGVLQRPNEGPAVLDIGEKWRKEFNVGKGKDKVRFQTWAHHDYGRGGQKAQLQEGVDHAEA